MSTPAQVGRNEWRAAIKAARGANEEMRGLLRRLMRDSGPVEQAIAGRLALLIMDNDVALVRLDEIGRNTRHEEL